MSIQESIVAQALVAIDEEDRRALLAEHPAEVVGAAFLDAILSTEHPTSLTLLMCDLVRAYGLAEGSVNRAIDVIADGGAPEGTRAACLRALGSLDDAQARLLRGGVAMDDFRHLFAIQLSWENASQRYDGWWGHHRNADSYVPFDEAPTNPLVRIPRAVLARASELEVRRRIRDRADEYERFVRWVFDAADFEERSRRIGSRDSRFAIEALVDLLLRCQPQERAVVRDAAMEGCDSTPVALARLADCAMDEQASWPLRTECFVVHRFLDPDTSHSMRRRDGWCDLEESTWRELLRGWRTTTALLFASDSGLFGIVVLEMQPDEFEEVLDALVAHNITLDWSALLHNELLEPHWPVMAEQIAAQGLTQFIDSLTARVDRVRSPDGRARIQRALMRLRAAAD